MNMSETSDKLQPITGAPPIIVKPEGAYVPWGFWLTLVFGFVIQMASILAQTLVVLVTILLRLKQGSHPRLYDLAYDGDVLALATLVSLPLSVGLCMLFVRLRAGPRLCNYLALSEFRWRDFGIGLAAVIALELLTSWLEWRLQIPPNKIMLHIYQSAKHPVFLCAAIILAAPVQEEVLFRGFLFTGLARSRLGWSGASLITSVAWMCLHIQYETIGLLNIFALGLVFGWVRHRCGSLWPTLLLHIAVNLVASVWIFASLRSSTGR